MVGRTTPHLAAFLLLASCSEGGSKNSDPNDAGAGGSGAVAGASGSNAGTDTGGPGGASAGSGTSGGSAGSLAGSDAGGTSGAGAGGGSGGQSAGAAGSSTAGAGGSAGRAAGTPREEALPDLRTVRQEHAVVALGGEIYVVGGFTPNATATVEAYDPVARSWRAVRDFPNTFNHANAAAIGNKLYVTGFLVGSSLSNASRQVFAYDPATNEWTEGAAMPDGTQRGSSCVAVLGTVMYVFGGARAASVTDASAYDTVANSWEPLPALPEAREHCAAGTIDGIIYIAAGRSGGISGFRPTTLAFDPVAKTYSGKAPIPTPRGGVASAVLDGRLFVFGGEGNSAVTSGVFPDVEVYDPVSNTWDELPSLMVPRHGYGAATLDGRIYLAGGATTQGLGAANDMSVFYLE